LLPSCRGTQEGVPIEFDDNKIDDAVLALLYLSLHEGHRAWKGLDWPAMDRLHEQGLISNPATKAKSVETTWNR
jgi:hypothetical protein